MSLQDSLRELVATRGVRVTADAAEFRGALDDFLDEAEATTGEVNLLVDAVRLGGLERLVSLLDNGASTEAAVAEAGAGLARDRGSDDDRRSRWAVAVLGYAVGRLDVAAIPTHTVDEPTSTAPATPGTVGRPESDETALLQGAPGFPPPPPPPQSFPQTPQQPVPLPPDRTPAAVSERRRGPGMVILAIAIVLGLVAGVGFAVWETQRGDDTSGGSDPSSSSDGSSGGPSDAVPASTILVPYRDDAEALAIYAVDAETGEWTTFADGPADDLPAISPDRGTVTYLADDAAGLPVLTQVDVASGGDPEPVFPPTGPCAHALRPGWSLDGQRFAIVCTGDDAVTDGIFVCGSDGRGAEEVLPGGDFRGSPTWIDADTFVYGREDPDTGGDTFWTYDVPTGTSTQLQLPDDPEADLTHADWSDPAQQLLFLVHGDDAEYGRLWVGGADLQDAHALGSTDYAHPVWSPDGTRIAALWRDPEDGDAPKLVVIDPATPDDPTVLADLSPQPNGTPTIPVWASR